MTKYITIKLTEEVQAKINAAREIMLTATEQELRDYAQEGGDTQQEAIVRVAAKRELAKRGFDPKVYSR